MKKRLTLQNNRDIFTFAMEVGLFFMPKIKQKVTEVEVVRTRITLACTECKQRNYNMTKDKKTHPDRMETKKYCRFCKKHTLHKETKQYPFKPRLSKGSDNMGSEKEIETQKTSWFTGLKAEFRKIIWPTKENVAKETTAVVITSIILGLIIAMLDFVIQYGVNFLVGLQEG